MFLAKQCLFNYWQSRWFTRKITIYRESKVDSKVVKEIKWLGIIPWETHTEFFHYDYFFSDDYNEELDMFLDKWRDGCRVV